MVAALFSEWRCGLIPSPGGDHDELLTRFPAQESHRSSMAAGRKPRHPELLSGVFIEGAESLIIGRGDEDEPSCRNDGTTDIRSTGPGDASSSSNSPSGTRHRNSPEVRSIAVKEPQGGFWQGYLLASQNRPRSARRA